MDRDVILAALVEVAEHTDELDGLPVFWRERAGQGTPALYLHDVPLSSDEWAPFLAAETGPAVAVDLPGFGRTGKPGSLSYDPPFYEAWIKRFLDWRELDRVHLVMHGWGALGLLLPPERIARVVMIAPLPAYRWTRAQRLWRRPVLGELAIGATTRRRFMRALPASLAEGAWSHFDPGTQRALLRLYRGADDSTVTRLGMSPADIPGPALLACGESDPYIAADFADAYGARMPGTTVVQIEGAGHWPWLDEPDLVARVIAFLRT
jgi:pimeloyl-ACP methyl ester carboxylesterase